MQPILITHPISGKVLGSFTSPPWLSQPPEEENEEQRMPLPMFLTLCGLLPFLLVSCLHLLYAYLCWPQYTYGWRWVGLLVLNLLVIVPYVNVVAFPVVLLWLCLCLLGCRRHTPGEAAMSGGGNRPATLGRPPPSAPLEALSEEQLALPAMMSTTSQPDSAALSLE